MSRGQYAGKRVRLINRRKRSEKGQRKISKSIALMVALVSIIAVAAGSTLAILITQAKPIVNTFNYSNVACEVQEDSFTNGTSVEKTNVSVKNIGDTESYIRAAIVVTWKDSEGNVCARAPKEGVDYEMELNTEGNWFSGKDGFYYYTKPVSPQQSTDILINKCYLCGNGLEGYGLSVEILASAIQSKPEKAVEASWPVNVSNGIISE